ncbi:MAG TPA: terpene cyclase/mutase family protein, partial [Thermoguttaceae bacterium]|nr:terpene cyclase/mutase family protein [Thermoguttaceae bacterium]
GDTILESETILLLTFLGRENTPLAKDLARHLVETQLPEGGWSMYPDGKVEISGTVKAYFALKLTGHDPSAEHMQRAREAILAHGGADAVNSYTRFYLALLGQIPYDQCPAVPPEVCFLPKWFPANLYAVSSWSRTIIVPLSIVSAKQPTCELDPRRGIRELFLQSPENWPPLRCPGLPGRTGWLSWDRFFRTVDRGLKWAARHRLMPLRGRAIAAAERWMLDRFEHSDGLGAIYPPIVWSILALRCLGYEDESPELQECYKQLDALVLRGSFEDDSNENSSTENGAGKEGTPARLQPCKSPVWDTAITLRALSVAGLRPDSPTLRRAADWLLKRQVTRSGDWAETVDVEPGGWCFEYANDFYPDSDDTAAVLAALHRQFAKSPETCQALPPELRLLAESVENDSDEDSDGVETSEVGCLGEATVAVEKGLRWLLAMQNDDGGWGAFDRNNNRKFLCYVPFADHNAMIDPSTPDLTGGVLESLGQLGRRLGDPAVDRAVEYMRSTQEPDGSWFGRWGVNYVYGTWKAITGLIGVGVPADDPVVAAGVNWLLAYQQEGGGWGESPDSYEKPELRGQGTPTASQTAWALLGLVAAGLEDHPAVIEGVRFLVETQADDGTWNEPEFTGTGFPCVFYLKYHYYPIYFPLLALAEWAIKVDPLLAVEQTPKLRIAEPLDETTETEDPLLVSKS